MLKNILYKTPVNSRNTVLYKNNSYSSIYPKSDDKIIYKMRERLLTPKSLSIFTSSRNNSKFNSNFNSLSFSIKTTSIEHPPLSLYKFYHKY